MNKNKLSSTFILIGLIFFFTLNFYIFAYHSNLLNALEIVDGDKVFYTEQFQRLILNKETIFNWPQYRVLSPFISIFLSLIFNINFAQSMVLLSYLSGVATIIFLYSKFYIISLSEKPTTKEIKVKRILMPVIYASSPVIIQHSISYFVDILTIFLGFLLIYYTHQFVTKNKFKYFLGMVVLFILSIANKETALMYPIILLGYIIFIKKDSLKKTFNFDFIVRFILFWLVGVAYYYHQYSYLFSKKKHLILGYLSPSLAKYAGIIGHVAIQFRSLSHQLYVFFFTSRFFLFLSSFLFAYSLFVLVLLPAYYKLYKNSDKHGKIRLIISHLLIIGVVVIWSIDAVGSRYVFYLTAPVFFIVGINYLYNVISSLKIKETKAYVCLIILNYIVGIILIYLYIITHYSTHFANILGMG